MPYFIIESRYAKTVALAQEEPRECTKRSSGLSPTRGKEKIAYSDKNWRRTGLINPPDEAPCSTPSQ